jgi:hypothetical protein
VSLQIDQPAPDFKSWFIVVDGAIASYLTQSEFFKENIGAMINDIIQKHLR